MVIGVVIAEKYKIMAVLSTIGEAVLYSAISLSDSSFVTVREFFPSSYCKRETQEDQVSVRPVLGKEVLFASLKEEFLEKGRLLKALSDNDGALLKCIAVEEKNGTAYTVFRDSVYETLSDFLARHGGKVKWNTLKRMLAPVITLLTDMERQGFHHRGISPESLLVTETQQLILTDFLLSEARGVGGALPAELCFGYTAPEQYTPGGWQGGFTDVYSLAAVCYCALSGIPPVDAGQSRRTERAELTDLSEDTPKYVSDAIAKALSHDSSQRPQSVSVFWYSLLDDGSGTVVFDTENQSPDNKPLPSTRHMFAKLLGFVLVSVVLSAIGLAFMLGLPDEPPVMPSDISPEASPAIVLAPKLSGQHVDSVAPDMFDQYEINIIWEYSESYARGTIIAQDPRPDVPLEDGVIDLLVSLGTEYTTMPSVVGSPIEEAKTRLDSLSIRYEVIEILSADALANTVAQCSFELGEVVSKADDTVTLYVAIGQ